MPRPNWFFGFPIAGELVRELLRLPRLPPSFRLFHSEDVHLTLAFLGGCGEDGAQRALAALDDALLGPLRASIAVSFGEVVPMGPRGRYSALSALLERGREETEARITALRDPLTGAATGRHDKRPAKAHVTLARPMRRATAAQREAGLAWAASVDVRSACARLDRIALYTWCEPRGDRLFRIVEERALTPLEGPSQ
jgi:2'-5' RNA ligase